LIRSIDAAARWTRLAIQPAATMGQVSIPRYEAKAANAPTDVRPSITRAPPTPRRMATHVPATRRIAGWKKASIPT
jgi:hypothetical protein